MQNQSAPVLIFAQSGRFLAQSATQAGYRVWVADCFGDVDTKASCERWQVLPALSTLTKQQFLTIIENISQGETCNLIYGSGIEQCYPFLNSLPPHIKLLGNSFACIEQIKTPQFFFSLLDDLHLPYPATTFTRDEVEQNYIAKSATGLGGHHIQNAEQALSYHNYYFQKRITGNSGSLLFLANGHSSYTLSINKQFLDPTPESPYRLGMLQSPWKISTHHERTLLSACDQIIKKAKLTGLNSLDFIISNDGLLFILEINPRPSASAELLRTMHPTLIQQHIDACNGVLPGAPITKPDKTRSLRYIYANNDFLIPANMSWPIECNDLTAAGNIIKKNEPICSCLVEAIDHKHALQQLSKIELAICNQLEA